MTRPELESSVRALLAELSRRDLAALQRDEDLVEHLGLDSLQALMLLAQLEKRFGARFPDARLADLRTLAALVEELEHQGKELVS